MTTRPRVSVLILCDFTGASFDEEAIRAMKESAVFDKPYVKKSAWVGAENFPELFSESVKKFSRREFPAFKTREEALAWLTSFWLRRRMKMKMRSPPDDSSSHLFRAKGGYHTRTWYELSLPSDEDPERRVFGFTPRDGNPHKPADLQVVEIWCALEDDFRTLAFMTVAHFDLCSGV